MYTKYYGFNEKPFTLTPNPRFIFLSNNHKEAFAHLLYGINNHYGFIELIGEVGTGKTTVLRTLLGQLQDENYRAALIVNPCLTSVELLRAINHEFGLHSDSEHASDLLGDLNKFLLNEAAEGRTVVLVIDESQDLHPEVLEQIRLISNLETENDKLIQIVLAGQPELEALLERPDLRQLNQRIAVRYRLKSMSMDETRAYIRHRMEVAGESGGVSFSSYAIKWVYLYTRGVPRMINILCDRALLIGYSDERRRITSGLISRAIREILNVRQSRRLSLALAIAVFILILCGTLVLTFERWMPVGPLKPLFSSPRSTAKASGESIPAAALPAAQQPQGSDLQQKILLCDQQDTHIHAFNAIAEKWGARPIKIMSGKLTIPEAYTILAEKRNLCVTPFKGSLDEVLRFDLP
ncbi:MAG: AAA family ATPase, partial [Pelobacteraceae bacterium]